MSVIAIVDYGAGNIKSISNALDSLGQTYRIAQEPAELNEATGILLPGVGHFGQMLGMLRSNGMAVRLQAEAAEGTPILGICLGMQALFESSEEGTGERGLGLFEGEVKRFRGVERVPHMGWNDVWIRGGRTEAFYFAHSYYAPVGDFTTGLSEYGVEFSAIVRRGCVAGVQFHPEKSGQAGLALLFEWCRSC